MWLRLWRDLSLRQRLRLWRDLKAQSLGGSSWFAIASHRSAADRWRQSQSAGNPADSRDRVRPVPPAGKIKILELYTWLYIKRGSVPPRCPLGSAIFSEFFRRNGSN
jgi:hypothetical protein